MDELLVIDKILDFIVPVKLRGKHMGVLMERGVKLLKRCDSTMTKWAHAGYLVPVRVGGKHLYRKSDVDKLIGK